MEKEMKCIFCSTQAKNLIKGKKDEGDITLLG
jgi:hypothetical protein